MTVRSFGSILGLALLVAACGGGEPAEEPAAQDGAGAALAALQAAPCDAATIAAIADSVLSPLLTGIGHVENEVMDCQRLVMSTGPNGSYGPLAALFPMDGTLAQPRAAFATPQPAVTTYSWGGDAAKGYADSYPELEITQGAACVWLRNSADAADGWQAAIASGAPCGSATAPADAAFNHPVFERTYPDTGPNDYPRTARWEWDLSGARQFIGVKCGDAWCGVMAAGSAAPRTQPLVGGDLAPRESVPGWSDAQHLAIYDSAAARARPGPWGALVAFAGMQKDSISWSEGIFAAHIRVEGATSDPGHQRYLDWFFLDPYSGFSAGEFILRFPGQYDEAWYEAGPMRRRQAKRVQYAPTSPHQVGTVRWRWEETGERIWTFCPSGSCYVGL